MANEYTISENRKRIILALANCRMQVSEVARDLYMHRNTVVYNIGRIRDITGKDPLNFYDLHELVRMVKTETEVVSMANEKRLLYLGDCDEMDCEHWSWCGDSYEDRNTECFCRVNGARVYRYEAEEKCILCPLGKVVEEDEE